jgi:branched-chain amino acid transport system substrate-binding protein
LRLKRMAVGCCLLLVLPIGLAACGKKKKGAAGGAPSGNSLTIYSSLPLQGASRAQSQAVVNGAKLAVKQVGGKVGKYTINYTSLDDSTASAGAWDPGQVSSDARKASQDKNTIAYIGEFNSGASAISIPILNQAGIPQVSPANTAIGLTSSEAGAKPGEPQKYYPTGKRTYARVVPRDSFQGKADLQIAKDRGCKSLYIVNDKEVYGGGLADYAASQTKNFGLTLKGNDGFDKKAPNYRSLAAKIKSSGADCILMSTITDNNGIQLYKDLFTGSGARLIIGPDGVCTPSETDPKKGGFPVNEDKEFECTVATLPQKLLPPSAGKFYTDYKATYHEANPDPYAIYGYEAMSLVLDAIKRAAATGTVTKDTVLKQIFATKNRSSVLGTYSIDKNGDTTNATYVEYDAVKGQLHFDKVLKTG